MNNGFLKAVGAYLAWYKQLRSTILIVKNWWPWIVSKQTTESYSLGLFCLVANQNEEVLVFE